KRTETSPSSKRATSTSPSGTLSLSQIACASLRLAFPAKMRTGSKREPPWRTRRHRGASHPLCRREPRGSNAVEPGSIPLPQKLAGAGGFEPPDPRSKVSCLTAWPRPTNERGFRHGPFPWLVARALGAGCWLLARENCQEKIRGNVLG